MMIGDIMWARPDPARPGKVHWIKVGVAIPTRNDPMRISLRIDTLPLAGQWDGQLLIFMKDETGGQTKP